MCHSNPVPIVSSGYPKRLRSRMGSAEMITQKNYVCAAASISTLLTGGVVSLPYGG